MYFRQKQALSLSLFRHNCSIRLVRCTQCVLQYDLFGAGLFVTDSKVHSLAVII